MTGVWVWVELRSNWRKNCARSGVELKKGRFLVNYVGTTAGSNDNALFSIDGADEGVDGVGVGAARGEERSCRAGRASCGGCAREQTTR